MKPYYDDGTATIYHGDCREILPTVNADVLLTDPPYGAGHYETDTDVFNGPMLKEWIDRYLFVAVFGWPEPLIAACVAAGVTPREWVTYWPTNARYRGLNLHGLWREVECVATFGGADWGRLRQPRAVTTTPMPCKGGIVNLRPDSNEVRGARMGDVWRDESPGLNPNQRTRRHPNEKPESVMRRLVEVTEGIVVDPFMGSGTTLRAAKEVGRHAVGIELDERHCETAAKRMGQEVFDFGAAA